MFLCKEYKFNTIDNFSLTNIEGGLRSEVTNIAELLTTTLELKLRPTIRIFGHMYWGQDRGKNAPRPKNAQFHQFSHGWKHPSFTIATKHVRSIIVF